MCARSVGVNCSATHPNQHTANLVHLVLVLLSCKQMHSATSVFAGLDPNQPIHSTEAAAQLLQYIYCCLPSNVKPVHGELGITKVNEWRLDNDNEPTVYGM